MTFAEIVLKDLTGRIPDAQVDDILAKLEGYMAAGRLPTCYDGVDDWLHDFWPDFAWTPRAALPQIEKVLGSPRLEAIATFFSLVYQFDIRLELQAAANEARRCV